MASERSYPPLQPIHNSLYPKLARAPRKMTRIKLPDGMKEDLTRITLSIFVDCCNCGVPFQDALLALYLSGLEHGAKVNREISDER